MGLLSFQSTVFTSKKSERKKKDRTRLVEENFFCFDECNSLSHPHVSSSGVVLLLWFVTVLAFLLVLVALKSNGKPGWTMPDALKMIKYQSMYLSGVENKGVLERDQSITPTALRL